MKVIVEGEAREGEAVEWNPLKVPTEVIVRFGVGDFGSFPVRKVRPVENTREELHEFLERGDPYGVPPRRA